MLAMIGGSAVATSTVGPARDGATVSTTSSRDTRVLSSAAPGLFMGKPFYLGREGERKSAQPSNLAFTRSPNFILLPCRNNRANTSLQQYGFGVRTNGNFL